MAASSNWLKRRGFNFFILLISAEQDALLAKGHGDYLYRLLAKVKN